MDIFKFINVLKEVLVPLIYSITESLQALACIWHINTYYNELPKICSNHSSLTVVFAYCQVKLNTQRLDFSNKSCAWVAFLSSATVEVALIPIGETLCNFLDLFGTRLQLVQKQYVWRTPAQIKYRRVLFGNNRFLNDCFYSIDIPRQYINFSFLCFCLKFFYWDRKSVV